MLLGAPETDEPVRSQRCQMAGKRKIISLCLFISHTALCYLSRHLSFRISLGSCVHPCSFRNSSLFYSLSLSLCFSPSAPLARANRVKALSVEQLLLLNGLYINLSHAHNCTLWLLALLDNVTVAFREQFGQTEDWPNGEVKLRNFYHDSSQNLHPESSSAQVNPHPGLAI